jgi:wyosine [tRNA(Phe)-imidazoG37] synthetase (radical SAM superfamily)
MAMKERRYIYGPVPSRRLGRSLGVDLVPYKVCSYDCIYCQLGRTTNKTIERKEWVPTNEVLVQLKDALHSEPDYITLSGSGEPTLHSETGRLIRAITSMTDIPVAVITNGSLLWQSEVQEALLDADLVVPSLDAESEEIFRYVNRPHAEIHFDRMFGGLKEFRQRFRGQYLLEAFLLNGVTTVEKRIESLTECIRQIAPDKVQVNTVARPPAEDYAEAVPPERLEQIARALSERAEVVAAYPHARVTDGFRSDIEAIVNLLTRRPCSLADIASGLGIAPNEAAKQIERLISAGRVRITRQHGTFYRAASP